MTSGPSDQETTRTNGIALPTGLWGHLGLWALLAITCIAHWPAMISGFVWDDLNFLEMWLPRFAGAAEIVMPPAGIPEWPYRYYRPLGVATLWVDQWIYGDSAWGWHLTNLLIHGGNVALVYRISRQLFLRFDGGPLAAWIAGAAFAVHPIHVESVNWIAGRSDPLAVLGILVCVTSCLDFQRGGSHWRLGLAGLGLLAGLMCKEVAIAAVPLTAVALVLEAWALREPIQADASGGKKTVSMIRRTVSLCRGPERVAAALLVPMLVYFAFRFIAVPGGQVIESKASGDLWDVPRLIAYYSLQLGMVFPQVVSPPLDWAPSRLLSALLLGAGAVLCGWVFCRWGKRSTPLLLGVFWIVVGIGPSTLVLIQGTDSYVISERYLYLPSVGFALCVGWAWTLVAGRSIRIRGIAATAVVLLGVAGVTQAIAYGMHWRSEELLWSHVAQRVPTQVRAWNNLAVEYGRQGDGTARLHAARRAAELDPESSRMLFNHAKAAREIGKLEEALGAAKQAIKFAPDADWAWIEKGLIEIALGQPDAANKSMRKAIRLNPQNEMPYINLSVLQNAPEERLALLRRAIELNPMNSMAFNNLGLLYADVGKWQLAEDCLKRAIELQPTSELAQRNLAMLKEKRRAAEN